MWPKVLNDIAFWPGFTGFRSPPSRPGQMAAETYPGRGSRVARHGLVGEHVDHAIVDRVMGGLFRWDDAKEADQRACGAAVGSRHCVALDGRVPGADSHRQLLVALAAGRLESPLVALALGDHFAVAREHVLIGQPLPFSERDFTETIVDAIAPRRQAERGAHQIHGFAGSYQRARRVVEIGRRMAVARGEIAQDFSTAN